MNRLDRFTLAAALLLFVVAPAALPLATGRFGTMVLGYYLAVGSAMAGVVAFWPAIKRAKKGRRRRNALGDLPPLGQPGPAPRDNDLTDRYPDHHETLATLFQAIETGNPIGFRYRKDDGSNERRVASPRYLHEHGRGGDHAPSLCLNAYYSKSKRNENFAIARMSTIELVEREG